MGKVRTYKKLTAKQTAKVKKYTKQGMSQKDIARTLGVSKQRVSTAQKKAKVGVRVANEFWKDVKAHQDLMESTWTEAKVAVHQNRKWGSKRAAKKGKKWVSPEERQARMRELRKEFEGEELDRKIGQELEDVLYGDTPR